MGMTKTSTAVLQARGSFNKHPERVRPPEPESKHPIGNAPDYFTAPQREAWHSFVTDAPPGVLTGAERVLVEMIARLMVEIRESGEVKPSLFGKLESLIGKCGMTPADRPRVGVAPPKDANDFDDI